MLLRERDDSLNKYGLRVNKRQENAVSVIDRHAAVVSQDSKDKYNNLLDFIQRQTSQELSKVQRKRSEIKACLAEIGRALEEFSQLYGCDQNNRVVGPSYLQVMKHKFDRLTARANEVLERNQLPNPEFRVQVDYANPKKHQEGLRARVISSEGIKIFTGGGQVVEFGFCEDITLQCGVKTESTLISEKDRVEKKYHELDERQKELRVYMCRINNTASRSLDAINMMQKDDDQIRPLENLKIVVLQQSLEELAKVQDQRDQIGSVQKEIDDMIANYRELFQDQAKAEILGASYHNFFATKFKQLGSKAERALQHKVPEIEFTLHFEYNNKLELSVSNNHGTKVFSE